MILKLRLVLNNKNPRCTSTCTVKRIIGQCSLAQYSQHTAQCPIMGRTVSLSPVQSTYCPVSYYRKDSVPQQSTVNILPIQSTYCPVSYYRKAVPQPVQSTYCPCPIMEGSVPQPSTVNILPIQSTYCPCPLWKDSPQPSTVNYCPVSYYGKDSVPQPSTEGQCPSAQYSQHTAQCPIIGRTVSLSPVQSTYCPVSYYRKDSVPQPGTVNLQFSVTAPKLDSPYEARLDMI
ncbi:hypothetical protein J6590_002836 [Homalodisca vitripennis]|nr:hypothetical protein J6590_002836 [Homalodisca vitripennis]